MGFCYFFVFGKVFAFIHDFAPKSITPAPDIEAYFSFVITMFLAFGITFEIPIVVIVLVRMGLVTIQQLKRLPALRHRRRLRHRRHRHAARRAFPVHAGRAIPMCLLYEAGLFVSRYITPREKAAVETPPSEPACSLPTMPVGKK